jgi:simple sugar transport system permease protein/ribose transport system permease protein
MKSSFRTSPALALLVLVLIDALAVPHFLAAGNLWNILLQASAVILVGAGMTLVIATGGIDLSVGSMMAIASAVVATRLDHGVGNAVALSGSLALFLGGATGWLIARFELQPIIATLALMVGGRGLAQVIDRGGQLIPVNEPTFAYLGQGRIGPVPVPVLLTIVVIAVASFVLTRTVFGRYVLAVGGNLRAARLSGIRPTLILTVVYASSALLASVAGWIETARVGASDAAKIGQLMELDAIAAAVIGGTALAGGSATVLGTVVGALIIGVLTTTFNMLNIPGPWSLVLKAGIILAAVAAQRRTNR